jgi:alkanesulfonate monooxygenase SsuD/methylene tetrahydromethanopterin reductase-like flavin-dependent oxidoreductase (luciferase family)
VEGRWADCRAELLALAERHNQATDGRLHMEAEYPRMLRDHFGFGREVDALLEANGNGRPPRLPAAAERLARDVTVMGTYDEVPEAIRLWLEAGADTVDLVLPLGVPEEQLSEMLEAAAPAR